MTELIAYIDNTIKNCITESRQFGLCHLLEGNKERYPATVERNAVKAVPDDRFLISMYHRLLAGSYDPREDVSFGKTITGQNSQKIRTVVFIKMGQSQSRIADVINALPDSFEVDDYEFANVSKNINLIRDRAAIWNEEFSEGYRDKYQMFWHIYALEYDLQYIKCAVC